MSSAYDLLNRMPQGAGSDLQKMLLATLRENGTRNAFVSGGVTFTYGDMATRALTLSSGLAEKAGVRTGDRVAVMLRNRIEFPVCALACLMSGYVIVNVNPAYTPRELRHQLGDSAAKVLVVAAEQLPTVEEAIDGTDVETIFVVGDAYAEFAKRIRPKVLSFEAVCQGETPSEKMIPALETDQIAVLQYTGGTTGLSKGAVLTHATISSNIRQVTERLSDQLQPGQGCVATVLPMYHIFGFIVNFLVNFNAGATNVLIENPSDADGMIDLLKAHPPTFFTGVNSLFVGLSAHPRRNEVNWSGLTVSIGGGSAILPATADTWKTLTGCTLTQGYGMTETSGVVTLGHPSEPFDASVGRPLIDTHLRILDDGGNDLPQGEAGEVCIGGPQVMQSYWQNETATGESLRDGYLRTGDVGYLDDAGALYLVDRKKDMVLVSGFNVFPNEVEAIAAEHEDILECACIGVPDEKTTERLVLYVTLSAGRDALDETELGQHLRKNLVAYKVPKEIVTVDALPKTAVGKIQRNMLRDTYASRSD